MVSKLEKGKEIEKIESKLKQLRVRKSELLKELMELNLL